MATKSRDGNGADEPKQHHLIPQAWVDAGSDEVLEAGESRFYVVAVVEVGDPTHTLLVRYAHPTMGVRTTRRLAATTTPNGGVVPTVVAADGPRAFRASIGVDVGFDRDRWDEATPDELRALRERHDLDHRAPWE